MKPTENQNEQRQGFLQFWRHMLAKMFGCNAKHEQVTDDDIRRSVGGTSATSSYEKPGKKPE